MSGRRQILLLLLLFASLIPACARERQPRGTGVSEHVLTGAPVLPRSTGAWNPVSGPLYSISGLALVSSAGRPRGTGDAVQEWELLAAHDNKSKGQGEKAPRVGLVRVTDACGARVVSYQPVRWETPGTEVPDDLEAVCAVPGEAGHFMAMTSKGRVFRFMLADDREGVQITLLHDVPDQLDTPHAPAGKAGELEGMHLARVGDQRVAVWATRGLGDERARLYGSTYKYEDKGKSFQLEQAVELGNPIYAPLDVHDRSTLRHVSDLRVDADGVVWASAASDPDNDGPFKSMVYAVGWLRADRERGLTLKPAPWMPQLSFDANKVEAVEFDPGTGLLFLGTDDEDYGGSIQALPWPPP